MKVKGLRYFSNCEKVASLVSSFQSSNFYPLRVNSPQLAAILLGPSLRCPAACCGVILCQENHLQRTGASQKLDTPMRRRYLDAITTIEVAEKFRAARDTMRRG